MSFPLTKIVAPLLEWYDQNARKLPWREFQDPYRIWVSEIMLQQTRVEAVIPYYERFLSALPTVKDLAECPEDELLRLWEGLGYYNRVRNMQAAAKTIMNEYKGSFPNEFKDILSLKGIGSYTAGAIGSIAFGIPEPAVDGNVLRVIARVRHDESDILLPKTKAYVEDQLREIMPQDVPGKMNQALMELGATVCIPNGAPRCEVCPWQEFCLTKQIEDFDQIPVRVKKTIRRVEHRTIILMKYGDRILLEKRPAKGLLAGLYEFPNYEGTLTDEQALMAAKQKGLSPLRIKDLGPAKHIFSHVQWEMTGFFIQMDETVPLPEGLLFIETGTTDREHPIPSAFKRYSSYLQMKLGNDELK